MIHVTLSREKLEEGLAATRREAENLVQDGVTHDELEDKKTTLTGAFQVRLAKTSNLAEMLLTNAERGFDLDYLDRYPRLIEETTCEQVNDVLGRYLDPGLLHVAMAGSIPDEVGANRS